MNRSPAATMLRAALVLALPLFSSACQVPAENPRTPSYASRDAGVSRKMDARPLPEPVGTPDKLDASAPEKKDDGAPG